MTKLRVLAVALSCAACSPGSIIDPRGWDAPGQAAAPSHPPALAAGAGGPLVPAWLGTQANTYPGTAGVGSPAAQSGNGAAAPGNPVRDDPTPGTNSMPPAAAGQSASAGRPSPAAGSGGAPAASGGTSSPGAVGTGELDHPLSGPAPSDAGKVGGAAFALVKNWDFGSDGTIKNIADLSAEFLYHDNFGTIANGTNYGAVIVAPDAASAIGASGLGLPNDKQPVEDPARPYREFTASTLKAYVRPLTTSQTTVSASAHNAGCGSITAKWKLPKGGALLKQDLLWETRVRMPVALSGYWYALWTAGNQWNKGAEMDVLESFGGPNIAGKSFHSDSVGGTNLVNFSNWPNALTAQGVPTASRDLTQWHTWTWVYLQDDSYQAYYDGYLVQHGTIHWTNGGGAGGTPIDMSFIFDFGWGHTQVTDVNISLPASMFPATYEIDYSRVYLR